MILMSHPLGRQSCALYLSIMSKTEVLYNDACPICSREIKHYDALTQAHDWPLAFAPLGTQADNWGITPDAAARRIHVRKDGELLVGAPAFIAMWDAMPRYRWLAKLARLQVLNRVFHLLYEYAAAPLLYRMHLRRIRKAT